MQPARWQICHERMKNAGEEPRDAVQGVTFSLGKDSPFCVSLLSCHVLLLQLAEYECQHLGCHTRQSFELQVMHQMYRRVVW